MSSCFFSSRLKIRISSMSVPRKRLRTALPKEPVPPVINNTFFENDINYSPGGHIVFLQMPQLLAFFDVAEYRTRHQTVSLSPLRGYQPRLRMEVHSS